MSGEFFGDSGREQITYDLQYFNSAVGQGSLLRRSCLTFWIGMRIWPKIQLQEGGFDSLAFSTNNLLSCRKLVHVLRLFASAPASKSYQGPLPRQDRLKVRKVLHKSTTLAVSSCVSFFPLVGTGAQMCFVKKSSNCEIWHKDMVKWCKMVEAWELCWFISPGNCQRVTPFLVVSLFFSFFAVPDTRISKDSSDLEVEFMDTFRFDKYMGSTKTTHRRKFRSLTSDMDSWKSRTEKQSQKMENAEKRSRVRRKKIQLRESQ